MLDTNQESSQTHTTHAMKSALLTNQSDEAAIALPEEPTAPTRLPLNPQPFEVYRDPQTGVWMVVYPER